MHMLAMASRGRMRPYALGHKVRIRSWDWLGVGGCTGGRVRAQAQAQAQDAHQVCL